MGLKLYHMGGPNIYYYNVFGGFWNNRVAPKDLKMTSWWLNQPNLKIMLLELDHFPRVRGENKEYLKPPPGIVFHPTQTI